MSEVIRLERRELVWETRVCEYTEKDFIDFKERQIAWCERNYPERATDFKKLMNRFTWAVACRFINREMLFEEEKAFDIELRWTYNPLWELQDDIRQMNWDCDICNTDYADDSDEYWDVLHTDDEE